MVLIITEFTYDKLMHDYIYDNVGFIDIIAYTNKKAILNRIDCVLNWYRFCRTIPLNVYVITDLYWKNICPKRFEHSIQLSCWCDVPKHFDFSKRLDNSMIPFTKVDVDTIVEDVKNTNFRNKELFLRYTVGN